MAYIFVTLSKTENFPCPDNCFKIKPDDNSSFKEALISRKDQSIDWIRVLDVKDERILIKFDISSLNGGTEDAPITVYDVKLKLHALRDSVSGGSVSVYYSLDFDEEDANWESDGSWADLTETYHFPSSI